MKKIFILLFLISIPKSFAQTYSFVLAYSAQGTLCNYGAHGAYMKADNVSIYDGVTYGTYPANFNNRAFTLKKNYTSFEFMLNDGCNANCNDKQTLTLMNLIKNRNVTLWGCSATQRFAVDNFVPNVFIKNLDTASPNEICAGFQLGLAAFPTELLPNNAPDFPAEVYHWVYSLDNKQTWVDVPTFINGNRTNDISTTTFSIQQLLGNNHTNYFNKVIYFKLAYGDTNPLAITYSPCAPIAENVTYAAPKCNGENIEKIDVFFDRNFYSGEDISIMYVVNTDPTKTTPHFQNTEIISSLTLDSDYNKYKYTFINPGTLEHGETYNVKYQTRRYGANTGSLQSASTPFKYLDPPKLSFEITNQQKPSCNGGNDGFIEITINSGNGPFHFYKDGNEISAEVNNGKYYLRNLEGKDYNIQVTDAKNCIDKTANDPI
ncbi:MULTISPECIES: SprB repeat-containing protein [unclassified Flavobacterium]|uniref:SprB repeat-containing protein n=1 Tax=unclassified Flavobacterium TaxID=196869 RepID=UPI00070BFA45|nr:MULTISPECIES: SprB repeat-containing protein [unclassified Flavobacterium]KRD58272.1 hypothetical protein ASE40_18235 [Flavobacterium sp. Root935]BDU25632.1 hypothetical protein FLGSB24_23760 [Flavobacterium sp. GSB-24]